MHCYRVYSRANCLLECKMDYAVENMNGSSDNCVPWYLPTSSRASDSDTNHTDDLRICYPWETKEFLELSSKVELILYTSALCMSTVMMKYT